MNLDDALRFPEAHEMEPVHSTNLPATSTGTDSRASLWAGLLAWAEHEDQPTRLCGHGTC